MKGLLIKDFKLLFQRKRSLLIILICGVVMGFSVDPTFLVSWFMLIGSFFALSTIAYDEYDNGYPFLMTLPITRKSYVIEKYVFGILSGLVSWLIGIIICIMLLFSQKSFISISEDIIPLISVVITTLIILDLCLPIYLKYGSERSRTVIMIIFGIIFAGGLLIEKFFSQRLNIEISSMALSDFELGIIFVLLAIILTVSSITVSIHIMEKRDF